jgi:hypothetical protein
MVTDRDITVRGVAIGKTPQEGHVEDVMSGDVRWCFEDQPVEEIMSQMADTQIRRVPVMSHDDAHRLVGIVSLGDLATKAAVSGQKQDVDHVMEKVSTPSEPDRSGRPPAQASSAVHRREAGREDHSIRDINTGSAGMHSGGEALAANAPTPGTSAGPGSTYSIGQAAGATLAGGTATGVRPEGATGAPARNINDAAGGPSTPAGGTTASAAAKGAKRATGGIKSTTGPRTGNGKDKG